jgi:hypothetical protein
MVFDISYQSKLKDSNQRVFLNRLCFPAIHPTLKTYHERWFRETRRSGVYCKNGRVMNLIQLFRCMTSILADSEKEIWVLRVGWSVDGIIKINKRRSGQCNQLSETNEIKKL